jgi:hypothetical protein
MNMANKKLYIKHTFESVKAVALLYKTKTEFSKNSPKEYDYANRRNIVDQICIHKCIEFLGKTDEQ